MKYRWFKYIQGYTGWNRDWNIIYLREWKPENYIIMTQILVLKHKILVLLNQMCSNGSTFTQTLAEVNDICVNRIQTFSCPVSMKSIQVTVLLTVHDPLTFFYFATGREMLRMFSLIRGIPRNQMKEMIQDLSEALLLTGLVAPTKLSG